jgi:hypothetical protein
LFNKDILNRLLIETDKNLSSDTDLVLIGGTALVVKYNSPRATMDVDTYTKISKELEKAWRKAEKAIGVEIPLSQSSILEGPINMEDRFILYKELNLKYLKIFIPDAMDVVLMKIPRLFGKDRDDITHLIKHCKIPETVLLKRFNGEMDHIVCNKNTLKSYYLLVIEDNYGKVVADRHERSIKKYFS